MPKENYSEKEVARIIKRAAELESKQSEEYDSPDSGPGLSLDELSQIAIDAGLDPENVRRAAGELSPDPQDSSNSVTVQSNEVISEEWVTGEFTDELADLVIADLNNRYNATHEKTSWMDNIMHDASVETEHQSTVKRTGKSLEWKKLNEYGTEEIRVLIQPRNNQIRIRVTKQNVYGTNFEDSDSITGFLPYLPYLAGVVMFFALPGGLFLSAVFAVLTFFILQLLISKNSGWIKEKLSDSKSNTIEKYRSEVQSVARDLANLIGQPSSASSANESTISIEPTQETNSDSDETRDSNSTKPRNRNRSR